MDLSGKIIQVLEERSGQSQRTGSEWKVATYVIETVNEQYPRKMVFEVFGVDRIASFNIQAGQLLTVSFDIDAHEYNGRWYNTIRAWRVVPYDPNAPVAPQTPATGFTAPATPVATAPAPQAPAPAADTAPQPTDDLPF